MLQSQHLTQTGLKAVNADNPLGLLRVREQIFQLKGFINYLDGQEITFHPELREYQTKWGKDVMHFGFNWGIYRHITRLSYNSSGNGQYQERVNDQLRSLKLQPERCHVVDGNGQALFIFTLREDPISFMTKVSNSTKQALFDYVAANNHIPQILSDYRLAQEWRSGRDLTQKRSGSYVDYIDADKLTFIFKAPESRSGNNTPTKTLEQKQQEQAEREAQLKAKERQITKYSDYAELTKDTGYDFMLLHKRILAQANRQGGFVDFEYKGQAFKIPKLPLIAWAIRFNGGTFEYNGYKWRPLSQMDLKTSNDDVYHTDWWIGAGIPLEAYNLSGSQYSHLAFNNELANFASDIVGRNSLESFTVLAGRHLPPVSGKLVAHPESIDQVEDGDILILSHANVEFDAYLKKACKSGKGAVIVETGNQVAHLSIVSKELGYRVILLPQATQLLMGAMRVFVDPQETLIKRIDGTDDDYKLPH